MIDDSPTFRHAMVNLGISREELKKKKIEDFGEAIAEKDIIEVRYKHYQEKLLLLVNNLLQERHRIKNLAYIAQGGVLRSHQDISLRAQSFQVL